MRAKVRAVGFKDMHPEQIKSIFSVIKYATWMAVMTNEDELIEEIQHRVDDMLTLLGGTPTSIEVIDGFESPDLGD
mgnify:CR=1 FL=1